MRSSRLAMTVLFLALAALPLACGGGGGDGKDDPLPGGDFAIRGTVFGSAVEGVVITMTGDAAYTTGTDFDGTYEIRDLPPGRYYLTPYLDGVTFAPLTRIANIIDIDIVGIDFTSEGAPPPLDSAPPENPVRLVFAHDLSGSEWLNTAGLDNNGGLGDALDANNYFTRDVTISWGTTLNPSIGTTTDIGHWWLWFVDETLQGPAPGTPRRDDITTALYTTDEKTASYNNTILDPGGENEVVLLRSSHLNSEVLNLDPDEPPQNLYGQAAFTSAHTLPNCIDVYRKMLAYFMTRPNKLFVLITPAPRDRNLPDAQLTGALNARFLNDWLVDGWLQEQNWVGRNVVVFDLFNVLTDLDNHHRVENGKIEHVTDPDGDNFSAYPAGGDGRPSAAGNQKATAEFLPLLNVYWRRWQAWLN